MTDSTDTSVAGFATLGLSPALVAAVTALGYEEPTPIQRAAIPPILAGKDVLGQAATGTGKTAAFALPLLQRVAGLTPEPRRPLALILVPTRELAMQVAQAIHKYGKAENASVVPIYGGQSFGQQVRVLDRGVKVVVATPGRALDHLDRGTMTLEDVRVVVLDEADEMLDMGFADDLEAILDKAPEEHQTALFSATIAPRIKKIAERRLQEPVRISIEREAQKADENPRVRQVGYLVQRAHKHIALGRVLDMESPTSAIVFCRTRVEVDELTEEMNSRGYRAEALHGGFEQEHRDRVMNRFRGGKIDLLIATDVAARGLDIDHVSHVVNFDVPTEPEAYVHRIGRTGRAGRDGVAITFVEPRERHLMRNIQYATGQKIDVGKLPTVADLRNRRLELTRASVREAILEGGLDQFHAIVTELAEEHDAMDVAAAAMKLAHDATHAASNDSADEQDIQPPAPPTPRPREDRPIVHSRDGDARDQQRGDGERPRARRDSHEFVRLFVGAGRVDGVRPGDIVGAITNETGLTNAVLGAIQMADRFSLVEVRSDVTEDVIQALRRTSLRGRKVTVRRDRHV
ncbi:MAG: DEAD/DEAH box helicase [Phycisphaerae bacterium]|nr:DEAD/DEAH box helicase [Phycisphaerae bacterium]